MRSISTDSIEGVVAPENYIKNGKFEKNVKGWAVSKNTSANAIPDSGFVTSGLTNTFVRSTSSPLSGDASGVFTLGALGNQLYGPFTINAKDQGKMIRGTFDYACTSYTSDAVAVWIYDVTNNVFIQPTPYLIKNHTLTSDQFAFEFQSAYNSTSYRLVLHQAAAGTGSLKIDSVQVGPQVARGFGSVVTDWRNDWTPTGSWTTTTTYTGKWRQVGESAEFNVSVSLTGNPTAASLIINLPPGLTIDTSKLPALDTYSSIFGSGQGTFGAAAYNLQVAYYSTSQVLPLYQSATTGAQSAVSNTAPVTWANGDTLNFSFSVPIVGFSAQSQIISTDSANGVVAAKFSTSSARSVNNTSPTIVYENVAYDTSGSYNSSTGEYTIKVPGKYSVKGYARSVATAWTIAHVFLLRVFKNGVVVSDFAGSRAQVTATYLLENGGSTTFDAVAGDVITFRVYSDTSTTLIATQPEANYVAIELLQGPSQILASADVSCGYNSTTTQSVATTTFTTVKYENKEWDSHGAYNTSTGVFTAPVSGEYEVHAQTYIADATDATICLLKFQTSTLYKYGPLYPRFNVELNPDATAKVKLLAGQTIEIQTYHNNSGAARTINNAASMRNYMTIRKVGQY